MKQRFAEIFRSRSRREWEELLSHRDVCFAPVLPFAEAAAHPHNVERATYVEIDGVVQPSPAPRFSRTAASLDRPPAPAGHHTDEILTDAGLSTDEIAALRASGAVA